MSTWPLPIGIVFGFLIGYFIIGPAIDPPFERTYDGSSAVIEIYALRWYQDHRDEICDVVTEEWEIFTRDEMIEMTIPQFFYGLPPDIERRIHVLIDSDCPGE